MAPSCGESLLREYPEVSDISGNDCSGLVLRFREDNLIWLLTKRRSFGYCDDVETAISKLSSNPRREHFVEQQSHVCRSPFSRRQDSSASVSASSTRRIHCWISSENSA